jgi:D-aminoacyl-tRNA deacylase
MRIVLQRVMDAAVIVDGEERSRIGKGFLLLVGVGRYDIINDAEILARKISKLRVFEDSAGKMNFDIKQIQGEVLSVPQFTLMGSTDKGNRPGFDHAAHPDIAEGLWRKFNGYLREEDLTVREGIFAANMRVELINDGPVTFVLDSGGDGENKNSL